MDSGNNFIFLQSQCHDYGHASQGGLDPSWNLTHCIWDLVTKKNVTLRSLFARTYSVLMIRRLVLAQQYSYVFNVELSKSKLKLLPDFQSLKEKKKAI